MRRLALTCIGFSLLWACDDSRPLGTEDSGPDSAATDSFSADTLPLGPDGFADSFMPADLGVPGDRCVIAIRTDDCCQAAYATTAGVVADTPCLELWPATPSAACLAKWSPSCANVDCMPSPPESRKVALVDGSCQLVDECETAEDCTLTLDVTQCCGCAESLPSSFLDARPCHVPFNAPALPEGCRPEACDGVLCEECRPNQGVFCQPGAGGAFSRCQLAWPD